MDEVVETVKERVLDILTDLKYDEVWQGEIVDIAGEGQVKDVKATIAHLIRMVENEL